MCFWQILRKKNLLNKGGLHSEILLHNGKKEKDEGKQGKSVGFFL